MHRFKLQSRSISAWACVLALVSAACQAPDLVDPGRWVERVTVHRDAFGVPYVHGETDAATVFGYAYAQAEDAFPGIEENVLGMSGRLAEVRGEGGLANDLLVRALETERLSREEYGEAEPLFREMAEAWAAGLNHYLDTHPEVTPRAIRRFEPWQMFALARSESFWAPTPLDLDASETGLLLDPGGIGAGSNTWTISGERAEGAASMIFINPHSPPEAYLEGHLISDEGLNVHGAHRPGRPLPLFGHTPRHGWGTTDNSIDVADLWRETFDHATDSLAYRYGDGYRVAETWTETLRVRTDTGFATREVTFRKTHRGPVVAERDGDLLAMRIARWEEGGAVQQFHAMARARSFEEFRDAVARQRLIWISLAYADEDGNIWYVYNGSLPRRDPGFDWTRPVDGSDPRTEWEGYHDLSELPQVLNPEAGWILSTNHSPFRVTAEGENPDPGDFPPYLMGPPGVLGLRWDELGDNERARASRRILAGVGSFDFAAWADSTMSTRAWEADLDIPAWAEALEALRAAAPARASRLEPALEVLAGWDRVGAPESTAMTLYALTKLVEIWSWAGSVDPSPFGAPPAFGVPVPAWDEWTPLAGLESVMTHLEERWGDWRVPWGDLVRLQRTASGRFADSLPSLPLSAGPPEAGVIRSVIPLPVEGQKNWYAFAPALSYGAVAQFGVDPQAATINGSGQSMDPASPHFTDQGEMYSRGEYKAVPMTLDQVLEVAVESYRPGDGSGGNGAVTPDS